MIRHIRKYRSGRQRMTCPECFRRKMREWHQELPGVRRGGRWCTACGYGIHPPADS